MKLPITFLARADRPRQSETLDYYIVINKVSSNRLLLENNVLLVYLKMYKKCFMSTAQHLPIAFTERDTATYPSIISCFNFVGNGDYNRTNRYLA